MKVPVVFRPAAQAEYRNAARWYESRATGVGHEFVARVEQALTHIVEAPRRPTAILRNVRRLRARGFPFFVYYIIEDSRIVVIAVLHARRNPTVWRHRK